MPKETFVDVSELAAPSPVEEILRHAKDLNKEEGSYLRVHHRRNPCMLESFLSMENLTFRIARTEEDFCEFFVWRKEDLLANHIVSELITGKMFPNQEN